MKIALTGGIACGKSLFAKFLRELGIHVIDADDVVHELEAPGGAAVPAIVARFGTDVLAEDGGIDRAALARLVFADPAARADLEIQRVLDRFSQGFSDGKSYSDLVSGLLYGGDPYMLIADYRAYVECRDRLYARLADDKERARLALVNTAESGFFAADRAIREYAERIWNL